MGTLAEQWNETYFEGRLSPTVLGILQDHNFGLHRDDVQAFVERYLRFMSIARIGAVNFPEPTATKLGFIPNLLPSRQGGMIPPITFPGWLHDIDHYVVSNPWLESVDGGTLLDLGCGFPPLTTLETAARLPHWHVVGADPLIPYYIVYDRDNEFASFDRQRQIGWWSSGPDNRHYLDPDATHTAFSSLLHDLLDGMSPDQTSGIYEKNGAKLVVNPVQQYQQNNLSFLIGRFGNVALNSLDVVRTFNVLLYFDREFRVQALDWIATILRDGGLFICGTSGGKSAGCRYCVYRKEDNKLVEKEFAFTIDILRSLDFVTWYTLHDDCYETNLLAQAVGVIRADEDFCQEFDAHVDALLSARGLFARDESGYTVFANPSALHADFEDDYAAISKALVQEGYVDKAVEALTQAGYVAQRNCVDHISLLPGQFAV